MKRVLFALSFALCASAIPVHARAQTVTPRTFTINNLTLNSGTTTVSFPTNGQFGPHAPLDGMGTCTYTITSMGTSNVVTPEITQDPAMSTYSASTYAVSSVSGSSAQATITLAGTYSSPCSGLTNFRLHLTTVGTGNVTISSMQATQVAFVPPSAGGGGGTGAPLPMNTPSAAGASQGVGIQYQSGANVVPVSSAAPLPVAFPTTQPMQCNGGCSLPFGGSSDGQGAALSQGLAPFYFNGTTYDRGRSSGVAPQSGATAPTTGLQNTVSIGHCTYSTTAATPSTGQIVPTQCDISAYLKMTFNAGGIPYAANFNPNIAATTCTVLSATPLIWGVAITNAASTAQTVTLTLYNASTTGGCSGTAQRYSIALDAGKTVVIPLPIAAWSAGLAYIFSAAPGNYVSISWL